jgi:hypothetical protein
VIGHHSLERRGNSDLRAESGESHHHGNAQSGGLSEAGFEETAGIHGTDFLKRGVAKDNADGVPKSENCLKTVLYHFPAFLRMVYLAK